MQFLRLFENTKLPPLFHGSYMGDFETFDPEAARRRDQGFYGYGTYFTPNYGQAIVYAGGGGTYLPETATIFCVEVFLDNPYTMSSNDKVLNDPEGFTLKLRRRGHDGILVLGPTKGLYEVVVFNTTQITILEKHTSKNMLPRDEWPYIKA